MRTAATLMSCVYQCISEVGRRWPEGNWYRETIVVQYLARDAGPHDAARRFHISGICFMPQAVSFIVSAQVIHHIPFSSFGSSIALSASMAVSTTSAERWVVSSIFR